MASSTPLTITLRSRDNLPSGLAPAGPMRDQQAERRKALSKDSKTLLAATPSLKVNEWTVWKNGDASDAYTELKREKPLPIALKPPSSIAVTDSQRQRRLAAASRWHKSRLAKAFAAGEEAPAVTAAQVQQLAAPQARHARRGEFELIGGSYRQYTDADLLSLVYKVRDKLLKTTELAKLYADGGIRVPNKAVEKILYPKGQRDAKIAMLESKGLVTLGAPRQVLTKDQEDFALALCAEMAIQLRPLAIAELTRWAQVVAAANGTHTGTEDMRTWLAAFLKRVRKTTGIDLESVATQQLSKQRAGVLKSGVRAFELMVAGLLSEESLLAACGLSATGNWDEMKMDLNKMLTDGTSLVPKGQVARWEVDGERCEQITLLLGYMGHRTESTPNPAGKLLSLKQVREMLLQGALPAFGEVAGYPKLPPGFWDGPDFCVLVGLLIFKGATGADPAWLNLVQDKSRLMVATTESGYINTELKYQWYKACKKLEHCPFGKHPTIPNADSHVSNESIEMSAEMELEDKAFLIAPPGHSTHCTQQLDQTGGPIQHNKRITGDLVCNMYRVRGKLSKARIAQVVELATVLSFTPMNCSWATEHVGWGEDCDGLLIYEPLSRPHILAELVDDESPTLPTPLTVPITLYPPTTATPSASASALAAFLAGALDGVAGIAAGREAALAVLGRSKAEGDGWADEEDMEVVIDEEGSRARRRALPNGRLVSCKEFREAKAAASTSAADAAAAEQLKAFKSRRLSERVLSENAIAERQLTDAGSIKTVPLMLSFVRARTGLPVKEKGDDLKAKVDALRNKPLSINLGLEPEGYQVWLQEQGKGREPAPTAVRARAAVPTLTSNAESADDESADDESADDESLDDEAPSAAPVKDVSRLGLKMEIQGCDPDECDYICTDCDWEPCTVEADHGRTCDVRLDDNTLCQGIVSHRFLRMPQVASRKRQCMVG